MNEIAGNGGGDVLIDGMKCGADGGGRHVHVHLALFDSGHPVFMNGGIGMSREGSCWYWLHTHDATGIIHVEGPDRNFQPTLGKFFDVWHRPLSQTQFLTYKVQRGQSLRVYVNRKSYVSNPRNISLQRHVAITVEIGPPFQHPVKYAFGSL